jgi:hypothetical protein
VFSYSFGGLRLGEHRLEKEKKEKGKRKEKERKSLLLWRPVSQRASSGTKLVQHPPN